MNQSTESNDEMRPEYDFRGAVRGRHYRPLHEGYTVEIHKADGTTIVEHHEPEQDTIRLEPDVQKWCPDSDAVNQALRSLIQIMEQMPEPEQRLKLRKEKAEAA